MGEKRGYIPYPEGFETAVCHFAQEPEQWSSSAVIPPISTSTNFKSESFDEKFRNNSFGPSRNPTREVLEKLLAHLENGKFCATFASGSAATATCLALLKLNDHVICSNDIYGGTRKQLLKIAPKFGVQTSFVGTEPECFEQAITPQTKMIWIESPINPSLQLIDIEAVSEIAKKNKIIFVVDNTFLSPYLQRPLNFGADISLHSITKYINGHTDVLMGALITNNEKLFGEIKSIQRGIGNFPCPFDCWMVLRGLKTLPLRMRYQGKSALKIAKFLEKHPKIEQVNHPGLESHPKHELAKRQTSGSSGMITFYVKGGYDETEKFIKNLKIITYAGSLGGCHSTVELPTRMSHASVLPEIKAELKYTDNMVRMSTGLESTKDLIEDLNNALNLM